MSDAFFSALGASDLSPLTKRTYRYDVGAFFRWLERVVRALSDLTAADLASYKHELQSGRLRPTTINRRLHAVRFLTRWAKREGVLTGDPAAETPTVPLGARVQPAGLKAREVQAPRRSVQMQLNRGEARHALARKIFFGELGEFMRGDYEEIMNKASCLKPALECRNRLEHPGAGGNRGEYAPRGSRGKRRGPRPRLAPRSSPRPGQRAVQLPIR